MRALHVGREAGRKGRRLDDPTCTRAQRRQIRRPRKWAVAGRLGEGKQETVSFGDRVSASGDEKVRSLGGNEGCTTGRVF